MTAAGVHRTSLTADDGVRLDVASSGDPAGRPVLLIAGFKAPATSWVYQVPALVAAGYRVHAVDLRGHGRTEPLRDGVSMDRCGRDLGAVLRGLDLRDAVLVGGSMGGNTIWARIALEGTDRIGAIAVVDQTPQMLNTPDWEHGFYGYEVANRDTFFATGIPQTLRGRPLWLRGRRLLRLIRAMGGGSGVITPAELTLLQDHARRDWRPTIADTGVPVLFVAGSESEFWPCTHAPASAALASRGSATVLARDGHAANIEQPHEFNSRLLRWLRGDR